MTSSTIVLLHSMFMIVCVYMWHWHSLDCWNCSINRRGTFVWAIAGQTAGTEAFSSAGLNELSNQFPRTDTLQRSDPWGGCVLNFHAACHAIWSESPSFWVPRLAFAPLSLHEPHLRRQRSMLFSTSQKALLLFRSRHSSFTTPRWPCNAASVKWKDKRKMLAVQRRFTSWLLDTHWCCNLMLIDADWR